MDAASPHETDSALMRRMACGEAEAFDRLFQRHRRAVYGFIYRMCGDDSILAEDLAQECFLRLWRGRAAYRPVETASVRTYLLTIARNLCLDERRRRTVRPDTTSRVDRDYGAAGAQEGMLDAKATCSGGGSNPERALLARELASVVKRAFGALPAEQREVLLLQTNEGLMYEEIAHITGCPIGTVRSRLNAARTRLRAAVIAYEKETADE